MTRDEFERKIVEKAQSDATFRSALMADPKGTLQAELQTLQAGITLPEGLKVTVVEESPSQLYLRIPAAASTEMAEAEMAGMTGGAGTPAGATIIVALDITAVVTPSPTYVVIAGPPVVVV